MVRIANRDGEERELRAPVIIAAHGSWEVGHLPSNLARTNCPGDLLGFKAHFRGAALAPDLMPLWTVLDTTPEGRGGDWYPKLEY